MPKCSRNVPIYVIIFDHWNKLHLDPMIRSYNIQLKLLAILNQNTQHISQLLSWQNCKVFFFTPAKILLDYYVIFIHVWLFVMYLLLSIFCTFKNGFEISKLTWSHFQIQTNAYHTSKKIILCKERILPKEIHSLVKAWFIQIRFFWKLGYQNL